MLMSMHKPEEEMTELEKEKRIKERGDAEEAASTVTIRKADGTIVFDKGVATDVATGEGYKAQ